MKRKKFASRRLIVRPFRISDHSRWRETYVSLLPVKNKYDKAPVDPKKCSLANFKRVLARHERLAKRDEIYIYGVFLKSDGTLVGSVDLLVMVRRGYQLANLGYRVFNRHWGQGYGSEAALAVAEIAFTHLKLNRLEAAINLDNPRSIGVARAISMRHEGIRRRYLYENGRWTDKLVFTLIPEDLGLKASRPRTLE